MLTLQIATLEMKSMNEKERADHADSRYKLLQSQNNQIEKVITHENQGDEMFNYLRLIKYLRLLDKIPVPNFRETKN